MFHKLSSSDPFHKGPRWCSGQTTRLLPSRTGSDSRRGRRSSHVGIVPDDAAGRWIFSEISRFPRLYIPAPALLHSYLVSPLSALKTSRHDGNTARLARRSDEALGVRVSLARIAPTLLDFGRAEKRWNVLIWGLGAPRGNPPSITSPLTRNIGAGILRESSQSRSTKDPALMSAWMHWNTRAAGESVCARGVETNPCSAL
ncbi:hypothetical protein PR048_004375 [Dryococelus australis]|uniref:Uncharacterized protein n=1 Tax=Dryococelus australis TaxID=614101 RepID=A0ABQ9I5A2_9NEOP|nr:hypothetical protein PR048_004375 [Dryococelus australis]